MTQTQLTLPQRLMLVKQNLEELQTMPSVQQNMIAVMLIDESLGHMSYAIADITGIDAAKVRASLPS